MAKGAELIINQFIDELKYAGLSEMACYHGQVVGNKIEIKLGGLINAVIRVQIDFLCELFQAGVYGFKTGIRSGLQAVRTS